jgi:hypothetical protein
MSIDQREQLKFISSSFMKVVLGVSGAALTIAFYMQLEEAREFRKDVKRSFEQIEAHSEEYKQTMEEIKSDVRLIDYRLKQIEQ